MTATISVEERVKQLSAKSTRRPDATAEAALAAAATLEATNARRAQAANGAQQAPRPAPRQTEAPAGNVDDAAEKPAPEKLAPSGQRRISTRLELLRRAGVHGGVIAVLIALSDADLENPGCWLNTSEIGDLLDISTDLAHDHLKGALKVGEVKMAVDADVACRHVWSLTTPAAAVARADTQPKSLTAEQWDRGENRAWGAATLNTARRLSKRGRAGRAALKITVAISALLGSYEAGDKPPTKTVLRRELAEICGVGERTITRAYSVLRDLALLITEALPPWRGHHWRGLRLHLAAGVRQGLLPISETVATPLRC